jgi:ABC-2 type transport system permease protein
MNAAMTIACREIGSALRTSIGWVVAALFALLAGSFVATQTFRPGEPATLRVLFDLAHWLMLMIAPAISMRLMAEEYRSGTIDPLMAAPVSDWSIVLGKYLGALGFFALMLAPTLVYVGLLEVVSDPDYGQIISGYIGLWLVGMVYLAVGLLMSSLNRNQVVAYLATLFLLLGWWFITTIAPAELGPPWDRPLYAASVRLRVADFARGIIDTSHVVFFLSIAAWFVVLAGVVVESRRWR